ncbi:MAG: DUF4982 domain-containing protein [Bacteroidaceae bacterium]|nr:DUF4982 domain-containing protein [Bacteroidaceae bacterium]
MKRIILLSFLVAMALPVLSERTETLLRSNWCFYRGDLPAASQSAFDDSQWESVSIPHDWAIRGPFGSEFDLQNVAVTQNGETEASLKTGRTGGLPYIGVGWYRTSFVLPAASETPRRTTLVFDGAMSEAHVFVNGQEVIFWPYGYNSFYVDVTEQVHKDGAPNTLAVRLENHPESSRWYCGAGIYRNVHLIQTSDIHVAVWGTQITTQLFRAGAAASPSASVTLRTSLDNAEGKSLRLHTVILGPDGRAVCEKENTQTIAHGHPFVQNMVVESPQLWSPETPYLYKAVTRVFQDETLLDTYSTVFGIRTIDVIPDRGFFLNGQPRKFQGVCNHHDLGPLGAAINRAALRRQLTLLKDMGCDAIRTSHNMPAPELVELCDSMGFMMMLEPFDEWDRAKCRNGYHRFFAEWAEKDMVNMLRHYRNNASVVMWSVGNEVPTQCSADGYKVARFLQDICHREDPTRPVTCGMDQVDCVLKNGFAAQLDIPGFNYRAHRYEEAYSRLPQNVVLGSETSSTVSSRGVYKLPARLRAGATYPDHQCSGYDLEYCWWSNTPDHDFANAEDFPWEIGQFVWTGFDYLGEPSPYDTKAWPSHSSVFGIIDLASLPKDRYYLYRSLWNHTDRTLHMLPHWTWPGHEGQTVPIFVYTDAPEAELFVNGKSQGVQHKHTREEALAAKEAGDSLWLQRRFRLMWNDVKYEPGEIRVVAHYPDGSRSEKVIKTAGAPHHLELVADRPCIAADGEDLAYVTVRVVDKDGTLIPDAANLVSFKVKGAGSFRAAANGDASNLDLFHVSKHHAFAGQLTAIVQSSSQPGSITLEASAKGLKKAVLTLESR